MAGRRGIALGTTSAPAYRAALEEDLQKQVADFAKELSAADVRDFDEYTRAIRERFGDESVPIRTRGLPDGAGNESAQDLTRTRVGSAVVFAL